MTTSQLMQKIDYSLHRRSQVLTCPHLALGTRLGLSLSREVNPVAAIRRIIRQEGDTLTVAIDGFRFSIPAPEEPEQARWWRFEGFGQIVAETFVFPLLFRGPVQLHPGDVALDVGANIGTTGALMSRIVGPSGKVYAFEPGVTEVTQRNIRDNGLTNVEIIPAAVGDTRGEITLNMGMLGLGIDSSIAYKKDWHDTGKVVPLETLDHFVEERGLDRVDYIKMDIEGAEELAIRGASRVIERFHPKWSISSYHTDFSGERQHPKLVALLKAAGYKIKQIPYFHIYAY